LKTTEQKSSTARLAEVNPQAMACYRDMRAHVMPAPGVEAATCETVLAMQLAVRGQEVPFKIHAMRAMAQGVALAQLEALLMAGVGLTLLVSEAARAVGWLREADEERRQAGAA
jgi:hypothetical protein